MSATFQIELPADMTNDEIADYLQGEDVFEMLHQALDLRLEGYREQIDEITIKSVEFEGRDVIVHYEIEYSAWHGCKDMNYGDTDERHVTGRLIGKRTLEFDVFIPPPERTTFEEY